MKLLWAYLMVLLLAGPAAAWTETYSWDNQGAGVTYNVYVCDWTGSTPCVSWTKVASALVGPPYVLTDANAGLTQVEIEACNAIGCTRRFGSGFFHDATRVVPLAPSNVGVR